MTAPSAQNRPLMSQLRQMFPVWAIVFVAATGSLFALRWRGTEYLERGFHAQKDGCTIGDIRTLAGTKIHDKLNAELGPRQAANNAASSLGAFKDDPRLATAREHFEAAMKLCPLSPAPHIMMADIAWWSGSEALTQYHMGMNSRLLGQHDQALVSFEIASGLAPEDETIAVALGEEAASLGMWDKVADVLLRTEASAKHPGRQRVAGLYAIARGDLTTGLGELRASLESEPGNDVALRALLQHLDSPGVDRVETATFLLANLRKGPAPAAVHYHRVALALMTSQQWEKGLEALELALDLVPNSIELLYDKARCLHALGRFDEARATAEDAISRDYRTYQNLVNANDNLDPRQAP